MFGPVRGEFFVQLLSNIRARMRLDKGEQENTQSCICNGLDGHGRTPVDREFALERRKHVSNSLFTPMKSSLWGGQICKSYALAIL